MVYKMRFFALAIIFMSLTNAAFAYDPNKQDPDVPQEQKPQEWSISGHVDVVSDYEFRGISQSDESAALQASVVGAHDSGGYIGVWGSNVDFNDGDEASVLIDPFLGFKNEFNGLTYDIGAIYYHYPGADSDLDYDFAEAWVGIGKTIGDFSGSLYTYYSPDYFGGSGDSVYFKLNGDYNFTDSWSVRGETGYITIDDNSSFFEDYAHWHIGVHYMLDEKSEFFVRYNDTDLDDPQECVDICDERVIFGASRKF